MEVNLDTLEASNLFVKSFLYNNILSIISTDKEDKGKYFDILKMDITHIEKDVKGLCVWWRKYSPLEGKYMTMSNHFKYYGFKNIK